MIDVLIVEDDPMVAKFNALYLEQVAGFTLVSTVSSADEALKQIERHKIDLILLDIYMPGMNGLDFLAEIRKQKKAIDVIIISAANEKESIERTLRNGAVDYLIKPFEFERFQQALIRYRNHKKVMKEHEILSQADLDQLMGREEVVSTVTKSIPKGLTKITLNIVWKTILDRKEMSFTTEELAANVQISRVSLRKYLSFLKEIGVIEEEIVYGTVGRPQYQYTYNPSKSKEINDYL